MKTSDPAWPDDGLTEVTDGAIAAEATEGAVAANVPNIKIGNADAATAVVSSREAFLMPTSLILRNVSRTFPCHFQPSGKPSDIPVAMPTSES